MLFRTPVSIPYHPVPIDYRSKIVSLGSCFAVNIASKLAYFKFQNTTNPFGIIFNPVSMERIVYRVVNNEFFTVGDLFFHNERWHCFEVHSDLSNSNKEELIASLNSILRIAKQQLEEATHIIITYGTSWVYRNIKSNAIVANCHKVPQNQFSKELLSAETIHKSIQNTIHLIESINPSCNFIFTVSPVRHFKDGFVENQVSKSHLIAAVYKIVSDTNGGTVTGSRTIFPSYEIMMDELRDYRFYANDMLHPSSLAIDYIWQRFVETTVSKMVYSTMNAVEAIQKDLLHRPFDPDSDAHQKFKSKLQQKIIKLGAQYSFIKF